MKNYLKILRKNFTDKEIAEDHILPSKPLSKKEEKEFSEFIRVQKMIDNNLEYMAVFEDDIYLGRNASHFLNDDQWILDNLIDIDIIKLETAFEKVHLDKLSIKYSDRSLSRLKSSHTGTAAYIISKKSATTLLQHVRSLSANHYIAIDHLIFGKLLNTLYWS